MSLQILLPQVADEIFLEAKKHLIAPSPATLSHARFACDMALCILLRTEFLEQTSFEQPDGHEMILLGMTDSSPQGGVNWQNTSFCCIMPDKVMVVIEASRYLLKRFWDWQLTFPGVDAMPADDGEAQSLDIMWKNLRTITLTPAGLGSRRQSLMHKLQAVAHQLFLSSGTPVQLTKLVSCISSWTVDLGVESNLRQPPAVSFAELFPHLVQVAFESEEAAAAMETAFSEKVDMSQAVIVGGFMHICSNVVKGFLSVMGGWQDVVGPLASSLSTFLRHRWSRERLIATCLVDDLACFRPLYRSFTGDLCRWRWGDAVAVINQLLVLEPSLKLAWRTDRLNFHEGCRGRNLDTKEAELAGDAIGSEYFWSYLRMIQLLADFGGKLMNWAQACPCHTKAGRERLERTCPMAGRWLPFLADGHLETLIEQLMAVTYGQVLARLQGLTPQATMSILGDFEHARQHVVAHLRIKGAVHQDSDRKGDV